MQQARRCPHGDDRDARSLPMRTASQANAAARTCQAVPDQNAQTNAPIKSFSRRPNACQPNNLRPQQN
jgi:hypothetical protein